MGLRYVKSGNTVTIFYDAKKLTTGLVDVQGNFFQPNDTAYSSNPYTFTEVGTTGTYKLVLTTEGGDGWHYGKIDSASQSQPGTTAFRTAANSIQEIYDKAVENATALDEIQSTTSGTYDRDTDSLEAQRDLLDSMDAKLDTISGAISGQVVIPDNLQIPDTGDERYQLDLLVLSDDGLEDLDAAPTVSVIGSDTTDYTATRVFNVSTGGTANATMTNPSTGLYRSWLQINDADAANLRLFVTISGTENGNPVQFRKTVVLANPIPEGVAQEATLAEMKTKTAGTYDRDLMSLEAIREQADEIEKWIKIGVN